MLTRDDARLWESRLLGILAATLGVFGVATVYSASSIWAVQDGHSGSFFAQQQLLGVVVGVVLLAIVSRVDYHRWRPLAWPFLGITAALLLVLILPFTHAVAPEVNGARRWFQVFGWRIQPSELAKFVVVLWTAMLAAKKGDKLRGFRGGILPFLVILVPLSALVVAEPDLSTAAVLLVIGGTVLFTAGAKIGHFLLLGVAAVPIAWHQIVSVQYRLARMVGFLSAGDAADANWQITQSLIGMGSGRAVGVGFGEGLQKLGHLQYAYSDFIFSTIGEEWGFIGVCVMVGLYGLYLTLGFRIARRASDTFGMLLATGFTVMVGLAAVLHIGVTMAVVPTTGISLPFISFGRSSLLVSFLATGVLMNIAVVRGRRETGA